MTRKAVFEYIEAHRDEHLARLREYVCQRSLSGSGEGIPETARLVAGYLRELGCREVEIVPTGGHPAVFGFYDAGAPKTIVNYGMYDTSPANPAGWKHDPFGGEVVPGEGFPRVLYGRGAFFAKGPYRAWLNALRSIIAVEGRLPVNVYFVVEGEEEIGSVHLHDVVMRYAERLRRADAGFTPGVGQNASGELSVFLGNKGFLYFELIASGEQWGRGPRGGTLHSSLAPIVDSPAWRLVRAAGTLMAEDGRTVAVEGFCDNVCPPRPDDLRLLEDLARRFAGRDPRSVIPNAAGPGHLQRFVDDLEGAALLQRYLFSPTFNINGIYGGYAGPGTPGFLVPHRFVCNVDVRVVPEQEPQELVDKIRSHLDRHGYDDIEMRITSRDTWAKTPFEADIVQANLRACRRLGHEPLLWPMRGAGGPEHLFNRVCGLPNFKGGGLGHGGGFHAPDEYMVIEGDSRVGGLVECEQSHVEALYSYAAYPADYD